MTIFMAVLLTFVLVVAYCLYEELTKTDYQDLTEYEQAFWDNEPWLPLEDLTEDEIEQVVMHKVIRYQPHAVHPVLVAKLERLKAQDLLARSRAKYNDNFSHISFEILAEHTWPMEMPEVEIPVFSLN